MIILTVFLFCGLSINLYFSGQLWSAYGNSLLNNLCSVRFMLVSTISRNFIIKQIKKFHSRLGRLIIFKRTLLLYIFDIYMFLLDEISVRYFHTALLIPVRTIALNPSGLLWSMFDELLMRLICSVSFVHILTLSWHWQLYKKRTRMWKYICKTYLETCL